MKQLKPILHGRDHEHGGPDVARVAWETVSYSDIVTSFGSLVGYYRMQAASGDQPENSGGVGLVVRTGTTAPGTYLAPGAPVADNPGCFSFEQDGTFNPPTVGLEGTYFHTPTANYTFAGQQPFTVSFWIYLYSGWVPSAGAGDHQCVLGPSKYPNIGWEVVLKPPVTDARLGIFRCNPGLYELLESSIALTPEQWRHVACSYDGTMLRLYQGGLKTDERSSTSSYSFSLNPFRVGYGDTYGFHSYFYGRIDELALYSAALTDAQIMELASGG